MKNKSLDFNNLLVFLKQHYKSFFMLTAGTIIYCLGTNLVLIPAKLYSGGFVGISQLTISVLTDILHINLPTNINILGIINFLFNIPLFILAYTKISKSFLFKTFYVIILQTVLLTIIPVLKQPILDDKIALCLISACVCGFGVGTILRASGSSGGTDILGMFFVSKFPNFSVGKLSIIINSCVYAICMVLFDYKVAIYSVILMLIQATVVDHVHIQNVNSLAFVITKDKNMPQVILEKLHRGVTTWNGEGCYTHSDVLVFLTVISKHQIHTLKQIIKDNDPHGFMVTIDHTNIMGNFKKRLD